MKLPPEFNAPGALSMSTAIYPYGFIAVAVRAGMTSYQAAR